MATMSSAKGVVELIQSVLKVVLPGVFIVG